MVTVVLKVSIDGVSDSRYFYGTVARRAAKGSALRLKFAVCFCIFAVLVSLSCGDSHSFNSNSNNSNLPQATTPLVQLSTDTFKNASSQHATEVEPGSFSFGSTVIASFQVGRISGGGGADIGYATSVDGGVTWKNGFLPGITTFQGNGTNSAVSDTNVAYDPKHGMWMISSLPLSSANVQVAVSRSTDGLAWSNPIVVAQSPGLDKDWLVCDGTATSPHYGNCYVEWDDNNHGNLLQMSTSTDGGQTWSAPVSPSNMPHGLGGQPLVQPGGTVVVTYLADGMVPPEIQSFSSSDGGATWGASVMIATVSDRATAGGLRSDALPSAQVDGAGNVYVIWQDCRFRPNCSSNDLVISTTTDGTTWSSAARIPIDAVTSTVDHFIPGLGIDPNTSGGSAHLALTYYYYPVANCTAATCALYVGWISSLDGGQTWSSPTPLAGPMSLRWLPSTFSGQMVADYISTSFVNGKAYGFFAVAKARNGTTFDQAIYTTQSGMDVLAAKGSHNSAGERPVFRRLTSHTPPRARSRTWR